jgi:transcriptional regulator with XRE-family HTH domain
MTGRALRRLRRSLGFSQRALAAQLRVTENTVARWERDEVTITPAMARLVALTVDAIRRNRRAVAR